MSCARYRPPFACNFILRGSGLTRDDFRLGLLFYVVRTCAVSTFGVSAFAD